VNEKSIHLSSTLHHQSVVGCVNFNFIDMTHLLKKHLVLLREMKLTNQIAEYDSAYKLQKDFNLFPF